MISLFSKIISKNQNNNNIKQKCRLAKCNPIVNTGMEVRPCGNNKAMIDLSTGLEIDCGNGPHRQDCPPGTYCHITLAAARCCPKSEILFYQAIIILK